ncbi:hypothetical protein ACOME3_004154 [Neoechinorhynchus agilis]
MISKIVLSVFDSFLSFDSQTLSGLLSTETLSLTAIVLLLIALSWISTRTSTGSVVDSVANMDEREIDRRTIDLLSRGEISPEEHEVSEQVPSPLVELNNARRRGENILVTFRLVESGNDQSVVLNSNELISSVKRRQFEHEVSAGNLVRFIYRGQLLRDDQTVNSYGIETGSIIHCQVHQPIVEEEQMDRQNQEESLTFSICTFAFRPLIALFIGLIWYLKIQYKYLFTGTSTFLLIASTLLYITYIISLAVS